MKLRVVNIGGVLSGGNSEKSVSDKSVYMSTKRSDSLDTVCEF